MGMVDNINNTKRKSRIWFISIVLLLSAISINTLANEVSNISKRVPEQFIRDAAETDYHPSCTCAMGGGEMAVVDDQMKVHGIKNLRVVDASVMPQIISGNLNAPTQMIAARAADMILGKEQLRPIKATFAFDV